MGSLGPSAGLRERLLEAVSAMTDRSRKEDELERKVGRLREVATVVLEAISQEGFANLEGDLRLEEFVDYVGSYPTNQTILDYAYMFTLELLTLYTLWEYSLHGNERSRLERVRRKMGSYYEQWKREEYLMGACLLEKVSHCGGLLECLPLDPYFFRLAINLVCAALPMLSQQAACYEYVVSVGERGVGKTGGGSGVGRKWMDGALAACRVLGQREVVTGLLGRLASAGKWQEAVLWLDWVERVVVALVGREQCKEHDAIMKLACDGNASLPGLFTYFRGKGGKSKKLELRAKGVRRHFYHKVVAKVVEGVLVLSHSPVLSKEETRCLLEELEFAEWKHKDKIAYNFTHAANLQESFALLYRRRHEGGSNFAHKHSFRRQTTYVPHLHLDEEEKVYTVIGLGHAHHKEDNAIELPIKEKERAFKDMLKIHRCVQLVGPGGSGKTYLDIRMAGVMHATPKLLLSFSQGDLIAQLNHLAAKARHSLVGLYKPEEAHDLARLGHKVRENLEKNEECYYLILDNMTASAGGRFLAGFLEDGAITKGFVVITGREELEDAP